MTPQEVAALLTAVAALDDRIDPDAARVAMWCEVLDPTMPFDFAKQVVINHYANLRTVIMPVDFQYLWKLEKNRRRQQEEQRRLESLPSSPMPESLKEELRQLIEKKTF